MSVQWASGIREQRRADLATAADALRARGIDPVGVIHVPPSDAELRCDYWYYRGVVDVLDDLIEELSAEADVTVAVPV